MKSFLFILFLSLVMGINAYGRESNKTQILTVKWGAESEKVGFKKRDKGFEDQGPPSFFIVNEREIFILDAVNKRIKRYTDGKYVSGISLSTKYKPLDLYLSDNIIFILTNFSIELYTIDGSYIKTKKLTDKPKQILHGVWKIFKKNDDLIITTKPGKTEGKVFCLSADLEYQSCNPLMIDVFKKYEVLDINKEEIVIDTGRITSGIDQNGKTLWTISNMHVDLEHELFPVVTKYRFVGKKAFVMETTKKGLIISEMEE